MIDDALADLARELKLEGGDVHPAQRRPHRPAQEPADLAKAPSCAAVAAGSPSRSRPSRTLPCDALFDSQHSPRP